MINYLNYKDKNHRINFVKKHFFKNMFNSCFKDNRLGFQSRLFFKSKLTNKVLRLSTSSISKIRNRCKETGRPRFVVTNIGLSRAQYKNRASFGFISGLRRK
jgi:ribosomal protein S14